MHVTETELENGGYEQRYTMSLFKTEMKFVRRPISILPKDGTVCFADNGPRIGSIPRQSAVLFRGGKWQKLKFEPTHWTEMDGQ